MLRAVAPLGFLLVLQLCGSDGQLFYHTVREGDDATFSCENVLPDQNQCHSTNWSIGSYPEYTALFIHGKKNTAVNSSASLLQNCSMVLHGVTREQAEIYTCQQSEDDEGITEMMLFVASLSQEQSGDGATLTCSVTPEPCPHDVKWFDSDEEVKEDHKELQTSGSGCSVSVSFKDPSPPSRFYRTLRCEVKHRQIFTLFPRAPDEKTTTAATVGSSEATPPTGTDEKTTTAATVGSSEATPPTGTDEKTTTAATVGSSEATPPTGTDEKTTTAATVGSSEATPPTGTGSDRSEATSGHVLRNVVIVLLVTLLLSVAGVFLYTRVKGRGASERSRDNVTRGGAVVDGNVAEPFVSAV